MQEKLTRERAHKLLNEHVKDDYQRLHARMVANVLEAYARKFGENKDLWFITGLLHDLDFFEYPDEHPQKELEWFEEWNYPKEFIHAVAAHGHGITGEEPKTKLAKTLLATDELVGFLYAYSLMRPNGFEGMKAAKAAKKFGDKSFAPNISREEVNYGVEQFGVDFNKHLDFVIGVLQNSEF